MESERVQEHILKSLFEIDRKKSVWIPRPQAIRLIRGNEAWDKKVIDRNIQFLIGEKYIDKKSEKIRGVIYEKIRISSKGIKEFEVTKFSKKPFSSIQFQGGNNIFVMGDNMGNIRQSNGSAIEELNNLVDSIKLASISQEEKLNLVGDIETLKGQLVKPNPSKEIIKIAWQKVKEGVGVISTLSESYKILEKIKHYLPF